VNFVGLSDIGLTRQNNEDVWVALPDLGLFALADGMGGHKAGEVAAKEAVDELCEYLKHRKDKTETVIRDAIEHANKHVYEKGCQTDAFKGMGTTLCLLQCTPEEIIYAHVGDSRIYQFRDKKLEQLTNDHSLLAQWLAKRNTPEEQAKPAPYKNIITRSIGMARKANPEVMTITHRPGDLFILCSDGLSDVLSLTDLEMIITRSETLELMATRLIEKAKIKGSSDNITVLIVQFDEKNLFRQQFNNGARPKGSIDHDGRTDGPTSQSL
jgi:serine/threonine protein phosphatase PrpC